MRAPTFVAILILAAGVVLSVALPFPLPAMEFERAGGSRPRPLQQGSSSTTYNRPILPRPSGVPYQPQPLRPQHPQSSRPLPAGPSAQQPSSRRPPPSHQPPPSHPPQLLPPPPLVLHSPTPPPQHPQPWNEGSLPSFAHQAPSGPHAPPNTPYIPYTPNTLNTMNVLPSAGASLSTSSSPLSSSSSTPHATTQNTPNPHLLTTPNTPNPHLLTPGPTLPSSLLTTGLTPPPTSQQPQRDPTLSPLNLKRELLEHVDQRIKLAARAYVRELLMASMDDLD